MLPTSGQIDLKQIYTEYYKDQMIYFTNDLDLGYISERYDMTTPPFSLNDFHGYEVIEPVFFQVKDPSGLIWSTPTSKWGYSYGLGFSSTDVSISMQSSGRPTSNSYDVSLYIQHMYLQIYNNNYMDTISANMSLKYRYSSNGGASWGSEVTLQEFDFNIDTGDYGGDGISDVYFSLPMDTNGIYQFMYNVQWDPALEQYGSFSGDLEFSISDGVGPSKTIIKNNNSNYSLSYHIGSTGIYGPGHGGEWWLYVY
jgi:hypothetical protein